MSKIIPFIRRFLVNSSSFNDGYSFFSERRHRVSGLYSKNNSVEVKQFSNEDLKCTY